MKILIIEDNAIQAMVLESQLKKVGFADTHMALSAKAAIQSIKKIEPDLLLVDINLGEGDSGIDIVNKTRDDYKMNVIYISGNSDDKHKEAAKKSGSNGFLTKPIHFQELQQLINSLPVN